MWIMWFNRRFPARDSRCRTISPEEASIGAVPVQEANRLRSANRAMSPTSARTRAAPTGPTPRRSINHEPEAFTICFSSAVRALIFFSGRDELGQLLDREPSPGLAGQVPGPYRGEDCLGLQSGEVLLPVPRDELGQEPMQPVDGLDPLPCEFFTAISQHPQRLERLVVGPV